MTYKIINFSLLILCALSCARREALTGGEADKIPPTIMESIPKSDSTNIGSFNEFEFKFSERVDRKSFEESFYTIPFLKYKPKFIWDKWDKVNVIIEDTLQDNLTYLIKIGKGFKDLHSFPSDKEYQYAITKSSVLDSLQYSGKIYSTKKYSNLKFALYDTFNLKEYPDYVVDVNDENLFSFKYLKSGVYIPLIFEDANKNHKPDIDKEQLAFLQDSIRLYSKLNSNLHIELFKPDTLQATIVKADSIGMNTLEISFDREVNLKQSILFLEDTSGNKFPLRFIGDSISNKATAYHSKLLDKNYLVKYDKLINFNTIYSDSMQYDVDYVPSIGTDTSLFTFSSINLADSVEINSLNPKIKITFNQNFIWNDSDTLRLTKNNENIPFTIYQESLKDLSIRLNDALTESAEYKFRFSFKNLKSFDGYTIKDTTNTFTFFTPSIENYGSIRFEVESEKDSLIVEVYSSKETKKYKQMKKISTKNKTVISRLEGGNYLLKFYWDKNKNYRYDHGKIKPFEFSEPIYFHQDTIYVRNRWESDGQKIDVGF